MQDNSQKQAQWVLYLQSSAMLMVTLVGGIFISMPFAYAAFLGSLVAIIPALIFKHYAFSHHGARAAPRIVRDFYLGSLLKFISTVILFVLVLKFIRINGIVFILSFIFMQLLSILTPCLLTLRYPERI